MSDIEFEYMTKNYWEMHGFYDVSIREKYSFVVFIFIITWNIVLLRIDLFEAQKSVVAT